MQRADLRKSRMELATAQDEARIAREESRQFQAELRASEAARAKVSIVVLIIRSAQSLQKKLIRNKVLPLQSLASSWLKSRLAITTDCSYSVKFANKLKNNKYCRHVIIFLPHMIIEYHLWLTSYAELIAGNIGVADEVFLVLEFRRHYAE